MNRITDENIHFFGNEPKFTTNVELSKVDLINALNWYSNTNSSAENYVKEFLQKKLKYTGSINEVIPTVGFLCRIVSNGGILSEKHQMWLDDELKKIIKNEKGSTKVEIDAKPSVQSRIKDKSQNCIAELNGLFDELITSNFTCNVSPYSVLQSLNIKVTKDIVDWAKSCRVEYAQLLVTSDSQLLEGYSNFTKYQIKKIVSFFDSIILDCAKIETENRPKVRTRTVKVKTPEQILSKFKYCASFPELNLVSIDPKTILGATQLWVYNTKYRKLGVYYANDASGFSVLGTTLKNFDDSISVQKIVRKPEIIIPELLKAGKVALRTFINRITTTEIPLTGRIGEDTILLKINK